MYIWCHKDLGSQIFEQPGDQKSFKLFEKSITWVKRKEPSREVKSISLNSKVKVVKEMDFPGGWMDSDDEEMDFLTNSIQHMYKRKKFRRGSSQTYKGSNSRTKKEDHKVSFGCNKPIHLKSECP